MASSIASSTGEATHAWLWQDVQLADVSLDIVFATSHNSPTAPEASTETARNSTHPSIAAAAVDNSTSSASGNNILSTQQATNTSSSKHYLLHSQVLGSNSSFFRTILTSGVGSAKRKRDTDDVCRWQISAQVDAEDAQTVDAVLEFFYTQQLSDALPGSELLKVMQMADGWQAQSLLAASSRKLVSLDTSAFPISSSFSLPPALKESTAFAAVMARAEVSLLATFGNTIDIIRSPTILRRFLALSQSALVAWLKSPKLTTDAEESVLLLVSGWCAEPVGKAGSLEHINELHRLIRYSRLSTPYLSGICDLLQLPQLTRKELMELWRFRTLCAESFWASQGWSNSPQWYLPRRPTPALHIPGVQLKLEVTVAELHSLLADISKPQKWGASFSSPAVYAEGYLWTLELLLFDGDLWSAVSSQSVASVLSLDEGVEFVKGVHCAVKIKLGVEEPLQLCVCEDAAHTSGCGVLLTGQAGRFKEASGKDWWAKFIVNGAVCLTATVKSVLGDRHSPA